MKRYKVLLTKYPEEFVIEAASPEKAVDIARGKFGHSVWESEVEETDEELDEE